MFRKGKIEGDPKKVKVGLKRRREPSNAVEDDPKKSLSWIETEAGSESEEFGLEVSLVEIP